MTAHETDMGIYNTIIEIVPYLYATIAEVENQRQAPTFSKRGNSICRCRSADELDELLENVARKVSHVN